MANSKDPDQTAPIGAVCSGSMLFASILNSSVILGNYLQQTTSAGDIFRCIFPWCFKGQCCYSLTYIHEGLTFLYINADNLINKMYELRTKVVVTNPDIIIITEVYPKSGDSTEIHVLPVELIGYICFRSNVIKSSRGVVIYVILLNEEMI